MEVSNKADYALHAMIYVAAMGNHHLCTINEIAEQEKIPREYLAKILKELVGKGYLRSYKGIHGGYKLAKAAGEISFLSIIEAMDGPFSVISCTSPNHSKEGNLKRTKCAAYSFWGPMQEKLKDSLKDMTLDKIEYAKFYPVNKEKSKVAVRQ
jgi:Rrf2 family protein